MVFEGKPELEDDIDKKVDLDKEIKASGFLQNELGDSAAKDLDAAGQILLDRTEEGEHQEEEEDEDDDDENEDEE